MKKLLACLTAALVLAGAYSVRIVNAGITCTLPFQLQNNTTADATQVMANYNALVTCFTQAAAAGVNNDITALIGLTTPLAPSSGGSAAYYGTGGGSAASQSVTSLTPTGFVLAAGRTVTFKPIVTNLTAVTLNVETSGAIPVFRNTQAGLAPAVGGELAATTLVTVEYDGTRWIIQNRFDLVGQVVDYSGTTVPPGYLIADGTTLPRVAYSALFGVYGTYYGVGDGVNTFGIPDLRGRGIAAIDSGTGRNTNCGAGALGGVCGVGSTAITQAMITDFALNLGGVGVAITDPGHVHGVPQGTSAVGGASALYQASSLQTATANTNAAGTGISANLTGTGFAGGGGAGLSLFTPTILMIKMIKL